MPKRNEAHCETALRSDFLDYLRCFFDRSDLSYAAFLSLWQQQRMNHLHECYLQHRRGGYAAYLEIVFATILHLFFRAEQYCPQPSSSSGLSEKRKVGRPRKHPEVAVIQLQPLQLHRIRQMSVRELVWNIGVMYLLFSVHETQVLQHREQKPLPVRISCYELSLLLYAVRGFQLLDRYGRDALSVYYQMNRAGSFCYAAYSGPHSYFYAMHPAPAVMPAQAAGGVSLMMKQLIGYSNRVARNTSPNALLSIPDAVAAAFLQCADSGSDPADEYADDPGGVEEHTAAEAHNTPAVAEAADFSADSCASSEALATSLAESLSLALESRKQQQGLMKAKNRDDRQMRLQRQYAATRAKVLSTVAHKPKSTKLKTWRHAAAAATSVVASGDALSSRNTEPTDLPELRTSEHLWRSVARVSLPRKTSHRSAGRRQYALQNVFGNAQQTSDGNLSESPREQQQLSKSLAGRSQKETGGSAAVESIVSASEEADGDDLIDEFEVLAGIRESHHDLSGRDHTAIAECANAENIPSDSAAIISRRESERLEQLTQQLLAASVDILHCEMDNFDTAKDKSVIVDEGAISRISTNGRSNRSSHAARFDRHEEPADIATLTYESDPNDLIGEFEVLAGFRESHTAATAETSSGVSSSNGNAATVPSDETNDRLEEMTRQLLALSDEILGGNSITSKNNKKKDCGTHTKARKKRTVERRSSDAKRRRGSASRCKELGFHATESSRPSSVASAVRDLALQEQEDSVMQELSFAAGDAWTAPIDMVLISLEREMERLG